MDRKSLIGVLALGLGLFGGPAARPSASPSLGEALQAYLRVFPEVKNIGVIYSESKNEDPIKNLTQSAKEKNILVVPIKVSSIKEFPGACREAGSKADTVWVLEDSIYSVVPDAWSYFVLLAMRNRVKIVVPSEKALASGGLFYFSEEKEIVINLRILKVLGLKVSPEAGPVKYYGASS